MSYPVSYHCPRCGAVVELEREGYLADKSVTPYPLAGWEYVAPDGDVEAADGVAFVCGEDGTLRDGEDGCGEPFYLSYVRYEDGEEVDPAPESEYVELGVGPRPGSGPDGGPDSPWG
ncbi:MAG: hypothetical protein ABEH40_01925 [Haloferacaceae archaeon]